MEMRRCCIIKILIVEDEKELCESIAEGLTLDGYITETCYDGADAYEKVMTEVYDLIILDLNLPHMDGLDLIKHVRKEEKDVKILVLSARGSIEHKVEGLDAGASDYLTKPFAFAELEARIRNLLRRNFVQENAVIHASGMVFDSLRRELFVNGALIPLTKKELTVMEYFMLNRGRVVSQEELMEHAWDSNADSFSSSVRVHIAALRKKLRLALDYDPIKTKIGEGYYLEIE